MKKSGMLQFIAIAIIVCGVGMGQAYAQKDGKGSALTYVSPSAKLTKTHTKEELEKLGKLELTKIYMERINILNEIIPYLALHPKPGATLADMGIPQTPENIAHLEKEVKNKSAYMESVKETLDDIIPYADKGNIIWSILFYEKMIQEADYMNNGANNTTDKQ